MKAGIGRTTWALAIAGGLALGATTAPPDAGAVVLLCKRGKKITLRETKCRKKEQTVDAADLGVTGPAGAAGSNGAMGIPGTSPVAEAVIPLTRGTVTDGASAAAARTAAPKVPLFSKGQLSIYGKCFRAVNVLYVGTYIETTADGAVFDSRGDEKTGGAATTDFLNTSTLETDREVNAEDTAAANNTVFDNEDENDFSALAPDGTTLRGLLLHGAKQGTVAFSGGAFGSGDGCLWGGFVIDSTP